MRIVVAPDKFRGSLSAPEVAEHLRAGLQRIDAGIVVDAVPVADGGEGTVAAAVGAEFTPHSAVVTGPNGAPVTAAFAVRGTTAVIEMATASGLDLVDAADRDAVGATSRGTGELILAALDLGCTDVVLGVGGSACTDGGAGMLGALGVGFLDSAGSALPDGGGALTELDRVDSARFDDRLSRVRFTLASDVDNPLAGPTGAAAVFAPQKGASAADVERLDAGLVRLADVLVEAFGEGVRASAQAPGAGAAGGVGFAALAVLGAIRRPGADVVFELTGLADRIVGADLVVTGEGSLDAQSLGGKTPVGVARLAGAASVPVVAVCGRTTLSAPELTAAGFARTFVLTDFEPDVAAAIRDAGALVARVGELIAGLRIAQ